MNSSAKYGAISTKCKAMYGRHLSSEDMKRLAAMKSVPEIAAFLRTSPGWCDAMRGISPDVHRGALEDALTMHLRNEYIKICKFASRDGKKFLIFPVYRMDCEQILSALRRISASGRILEETLTIPSFYRKKSRIDYDALFRCRDYTELLSVIRPSIFYEPLRNLPIFEETGIPDYTEANAVLLSAYFETMMKIAARDFKGPDSELISSFFGQETDMLNIVHTVRLKKYFPDSGDLDKILLRPFYKLKEPFFRSLMTAPDANGACELIAKSRYGKYFSPDMKYAEQGYLSWIYDFSRRFLSSGGSSLFTPAAYLTLKELELKNLKNIIECVRYRVPVSSAPLALSI